MDSFFAKNRLSAYLDGVLPEAEAAEVAEAIEGDPELRAEYQAMRQAVELLRREGPTQAPMGFHARVMEQVQREPSAGGVVVRLRRWSNRIPVEAVALAAAAAVVVFVIQGRSDEIPTSQAEDALYATRRDAPPAPSAPVPAKGTAAAAEARPAAAGDGGGAAALAPADADADAEPPATGNPKAVRKKGAEKSVEPFVADWEQGAGADGDGATSYGYRLQVADTEVLFSLSTIAERAGGRVRDSAGRALQPRRLGKSDDYAQLVIEVPVEGAEQMHRELRGMGGDAVAAPPTPAIYGPEVGVFMVEVRYTP